MHLVTLQAGEWRRMARKAFRLVPALLVVGPAVFAEEKGSHQVSPFAGSLSYSIPIDVPPYHGIEPRLALSYSSEGRNGFVGVGWTLSGISTIERVNPNRGVPNFTASDIFLLDGQELVACTAGMQSPSCTTGGTHTTKVESYLKIIRTVDSWYVYAKDGTRTLFSPLYWAPDVGVYPGGAVYPGGVFRWGQTNVTDTHGNSVTYNWAGVDGDVYPTNILYNGYEISFLRALRPDRIQFAASTIIGQTAYLLKGIVVSLHNGPRIRAYKVTYEPQVSAQTGRSLLSAVQQFGKDVQVDTSTGQITGDTWLPAQKFTYQQDASGKTFSLIESAGWCAATNILLGDFNGDGRSDQLCWSEWGGASVKLSTGTGFAAPVVWTALAFKGPMAVDMNADGKTDILEHDDWNGVFRIVPSTGSGFGTPSSWAAAAGYTPEFVACKTIPVKGIGDFNGDTFPDVWCRVGGFVPGAPGNGVALPVTIFVGVNNGGTSLSFSVWRDDWMCGDQESTGAMDFDGDGKDELFCIASPSNHLFIYPSVGNSFAATALASINMCSADEYVLGDFNGDGRTDAACVPSFRVALSTGRRFVEQTPSLVPWCGSATDAFAADVDGDGISEILCNHYGAGWGDVAVRRLLPGGVWGGGEHWRNDWCDGHIRGADFNGDGKTDVWCDSNGQAGVAGTAGFQADLINSMANGLGGTIQVAYTPSTAFANTNNPPPKQAITSLTRLDGRGGSSTSTYTYSDGLMDRKERRFLGFRQMTENLPCIAGETQCPWVNTILSQVFPSAGRPTRITRRVGPSRRLSRTDFDYITNALTVPMTTRLNGETVTFYDETGVQCTAFPCINAKRRRSEHSYDSYGNRVRTVSFGDYDVPGDELTTFRTFAYNTSAYIVDRVVADRTFKHVDSENPANKLTETHYFYDLQETAEPPIKGDLTKMSRWLKTEDPEDEDRLIPRRFFYDQWGNLERVVDETTRHTVTEWDQTFHVFPTKVTNHAGEFTTTLWDPVCGAPMEHRDANHTAATTTFMHYDDLCRPTRTDLPLGGFKLLVYAEEEDMAEPALPRLIEYSPSPSGDWDAGSDHYVNTYFDGFGRTYRTVAKGPTAGSDIVHERVFNARGLPMAQSAAYYASATPVWTSYEFDPLDRVSRVVFADATSVARAYGLLEEAVTDEHGHSVTSRFNIFEQLIEKEQVYAGQLLTTTSDYDLLGRLTGATDALGNAWVLSLDSLGRVLVKTDPDAGTWQFEYDDAGRLVQQIDAKAQYTEFAYDPAGRVATKVTRVNASAPAETTFFTHSQQRAGYFNRGKLTSTTLVSVSGASIDSQAFNFDARGRVVSESRELDGQTFTAEFRFDQGGRLRGMTYPDGYAVGLPANALRYDAAGRLIGAPGIIDNVTYDASGRPLTQLNFNGTQTTRSYSAARGFLLDIGTSGPSGAVQSLSYTPDEAGLIERIDSTFAREGWDYTYDELHRLTDAVSLSHAAEDSDHFEYDEIGRITLNSRVGGYSYPTSSQAGPRHAPRTVGVHPQFQYDLNGNLTSGGGRTIQWNVDNLPKTINGTEFIYGATGDRVKKSSSSGTSIYPFGDDYELTNGEITRYVKLPNVGLVAKRHQMSTYWLHTDHLGSIQATTNESGAVVQRMSYRPYGDKIVDAMAHEESRGYIDQREDEETGLLYLQARYYDPLIAMFVSPDPIASPAPYSYAAGDPINLVDRLGLSPQSAASAGPPPEFPIETNCSTDPGLCPGSGWDRWLWYGWYLRNPYGNPYDPYGNPYDPYARNPHAPPPAQPEPVPTPVPTPNPAPTPQPTPAPPPTQPESRPCEKAGTCASGQPTAFPSDDNGNPLVASGGRGGRQIPQWEGPQKPSLTRNFQKATPPRVVPPVQEPLPDPVRNLGVPETWWRKPQGTVTNPGAATGQILKFLGPKMPPTSVPLIMVPFVWPTFTNCPPGSCIV